MSPTAPSNETLHAVLLELKDDIKGVQTSVTQLTTDVAVLKDARSSSKDRTARWMGIGAATAVVLEFVKNHWK